MKRKKKEEKMSDVVQFARVILAEINRKASEINKKNPGDVQFEIIALIQELARLETVLDPDS